MTPRPAPAGAPLSLDEITRLETWLREQVQANQDPKTGPGFARELGARDILAQAYSQTRLTLSDTRREELFGRGMMSLFGLGPVQPLMEDSGVNEMLVK